MKPIDVYLLLGGNLGNVSTTFQLAVEQISLLGKVKRLSALYESPPWGMQSSFSFLNQLVVLNTDLDPSALLKRLLHIEEKFGRKRETANGGYSDRTLDIDILFYGDKVVTQPDLIIPHPRLQERKFALMPMLEVSSGFQHPVFKKTISDLHAACLDKTKVFVYE